MGGTPWQLRFLAKSVNATVRRVPLWALVFVTRRCNLHCPYCYAEYSSIPEPDMTDETYDATLRGLKRLGCGMVSFIGGEPTVRVDLPELIAKARAAGMSTHISTNGRLLTREYAETLCAAGLNVFNLSADTVTPALDSMKPLEAVREALDTLVALRQEYGCSVFVTQVLTPDTLGEMEPMAEYLGSRSIGHNLAFATDCNGRLVGYTQPAELAALDAAAVRFGVLKRRGYCSNTSRAYVEAVRSMAHTGTATWKCRAGASSVVVMTDGRIELCTEGFKLPDGLHVHVADVTPASWHSARREFRSGVAACSEHCVSCCLFETSWAASHPWVALAAARA